MAYEDHRNNEDGRRAEAEAARLEAKAVDLMKKYGPFLPGPAKLFFRELADFLNWNNLKEQIK